MNRSQAMYVYLNAFIEELSRNGVRHVVYCPGSRSTPLAMRLAEHPRIRCWLHLDERSAAFFALGMAKRLREPVALLCTSGTAAVNFAPAVVEAHYARVPLVVLTADRPPELRDAGAPQTIDQVHLYGRHVRWFMEMALPETSPELLRYVRTVAAKAVALAQGSFPGPVHLNFPFREPLVPEPPPEMTAGERDPWSGGRMPLGDRGEECRDGRRLGNPVDGWHDGNLRSGGEAPYVAVRSGRLVLDDGTIERLAGWLSGTKRGVIVCGPQTDPAFARAVGKLAERLQYPLLADPLSQVRCGRHPLSAVVEMYDALLRVTAFAEKAKPEVVLRFGALPVSKPLLQYLSRHADARQIVVDGHAMWHDPVFSAAEVLQADPAWVCERLCVQLGEAAQPQNRGAFAGEGRKTGGEWLSWWQKANRLARQTVERRMSDADAVAGDADTGLFEGRLFPELAGLLPEGCLLYVGNSMPVRDLDSFFPALQKELFFLANRGANGIDGVVSSALGASAAGEEPVILVIGDLSFYHDLNGLLAAKLHRLNLTVILVNNDGGGIFSFLPQAEHPEHFEALFGTPHGLSFEPVVKMYGGRYRRVGDWEQFSQAVRTSLEKGGLSVIEVPSRRDANLNAHRQIWREVAQALEASL